MADVVGGPEEMGFKLTFECVSRVYQSLGWPEGGSSRGQGAAMAKALCPRVRYSMLACSRMPTG